MVVYNTKILWKLLASLLFITILIFFLQNPLSYKQVEQAVSEQIIINPKKAFVSFLCDDIMGEATQVLVHSLKKTKTRHDIVVLVLDEVTPLTRTKLEYLGAKIIHVDQIKYPWDSNSARRKGFNKACRYSKLSLWNLTQYEKVVFLDADTMVINSIDELFEYPQFSAVVDIGGVVNTGVFVAEPNTDTYHAIMRTYETAPSYNRGDQGFLNYYFNQSVNLLPGNYNLMVKFTHFSSLAASFISKNTVKVLHFTSETKPWNFYFLHQREWRENYDGYLFGLWTRALRETQSQLITGGLLEPTGTTQDSTWSNQGRVKQICDRNLRKTFGRRYHKTEQLTIILNLNKIDITQSQLDQLLETYASSKKVSHIFIQGNLVKDEEGKRVVLKSTYLRKLHLRKPVKFVPHVAFESINNKFNPIQGIVTTCVFMVDGNVSIKILNSDTKCGKKTKTL
ncbi:nucleotide-diphospho-sugar transferase [Thamnidium elegans]|nr:nucleotide-diphospho-sugar transferase [Thamnidium elegans]